MRHFLILVLFTLNAAGQTKSSVPEPKRIEVFTANEVKGDDFVHSMAGLDQKPEFPGGLAEFHRFIIQNFKMEFVPNGTSGKVFASFIIEKDGLVSDVKIHRDFGFGTGAEATRVLSLSPKWSPGTLDGKNVRVRFSIPINLIKN